MDVLMIGIVTLIMVLVIVFARKIENPILPGGLILLNLALLIYHTYVVNSLPVGLEDAISRTYIYIATDFLWLLISFLAYLWIDDISARKFNKKSYDNSISWFWDKL